MTAAERLLDEAAIIPFQGWDFSRLGGRLLLEPPPWSLEGMVRDLVDGAHTMLDMGTGGGEWLSSLGRWPPRSVATESWAPNLPFAVARLRPLGISVVRDEGAVDNVAQGHGDPQGRLAFCDGAFDLVVNRHESFVAGEVYRVLREDGVFITQQADSGSRQFHELLGLRPPTVEEFGLELAVEQLTDAGLHVEESGTGLATTTFADIGALAWYLTNVPWAVPGFTVADYRGELLALHSRSIPIASPRFWLRAHK